MTFVEVCTKKNMFPYIWRGRFMGQDISAELQYFTIMLFVSNVTLHTHTHTQKSQLLQFKYCYIIFLQFQWYFDYFWLIVLDYFNTQDMIWQAAQLKLIFSNLLLKLVQNKIKWNLSFPVRAHIMLKCALDRSVPDDHTLKTTSQSYFLTMDPEITWPVSIIKWSWEDFCCAGL